MKKTQNPFGLLTTTFSCESCGKPLQEIIEASHEFSLLCHECNPDFWEEEDYFDDEFQEEEDTE